MVSSYDMKIWQVYTLPLIIVIGFTRRGLIRAPLKHTDFATILWIHYETIHLCMFYGQQFTQSWESYFMKVIYYILLVILTKKVT